MDALFNFLITVWWQLWPFRRVDPWEKGLLVIAGRWTCELGPGIYPRLPLLMEVETIDVKTQVVDLPNQVLQTADGIMVFISGAIVYHIDSVKKIYLNVQDADESMQTVALMELADYAGHTNFDEITNETLEAEVLPVVRDQGAAWGINVSRVGITHLAETGVYFLAGDETVGGAILPEE